MEEFKNLYLPMIMAAFLGYIAYQQMRTNRDKLKLDLYNKRFEIYSYTLKFNQELMYDELTTDTHRKFIEFKQASKFLFDPKDGIYNLLEEINKKSFIVIGFRKNDDKYKETGIYEKAHNEMHESLSWIIEQVEILDIKMSKYLSFHK